MPSLIERTAISDYTLGGQPVRAGQVVPLTQAQVRTLAASGCVALTDEDNALVPTSGLPPVTEVPGRQEVDGYAAATAAARQKAEADISAINRTVEDTRARAQDEATALEQGLVARRQAAADELAQIEARVQAARDAAAMGATGATGDADASGASSASTKKAR